jgi:hypothetical protein
LQSAIDDAKVLLFERFAATARDLLAKLDSVARVGVAEVCASVFTLEDGSIEQVCSCMLGRRDGGRLVRYFD